MRKWLFFGLLAGMAFAAGCATPTRTAEENWLAQRQVMELEMRQMAQDWNMVWMTDRPNRLSIWHTR